FLDRSSLSQRLESQELRQHSWVRTSTLGAIAHLFNTSRDARLLGAPGSEVSSGQSGLQGGNSSQASPQSGEVIDRLLRLNYSVIIDLRTL
ncbi:MAG: hypothetical protein M3Y81_13695, partial [Chloroflexota bacterium]|nr:hypothetical protein [Chloroflexota bacterium]